MFNAPPTGKANGDGRRLRVSSDRLEELGIEFGDPWVQVKWFIQFITAVSCMYIENDLIDRYCRFPFHKTCAKLNNFGYCFS